jgi:2-hydroxy-6-oxonona-2,4-dienedioate hydrolase
MPKTLWLELAGAEVRFYDVGGIRTRTVEAGTGPALLLMHGSSGHAEAFARNIIPLSEHFRVIAPDYLGSGMTEYPSTFPTMRDRVDHMIGVLDAAGVERAAVLGESFGGSHAMSGALWYPDRVSSLIVVVGGGPYLVDTAVEDQDKLTRGMKSLIEGNARIVEQGPTIEGVRDRLAWLFYQPDESLTDELIALRYYYYQRDNIRRANADLVAASRRGESVSVPMTPDQLRAITQPTLFIWTDHNPTIPTAQARKASEYIPDVQFVEMKDCAHWPQWEDPAAFNKIVTDFLIGLAVREAHTDAL